MGLKTIREQEPDVCFKNLHSRVLIKRYIIYNQLDSSLEFRHISKHLCRERERGLKDTKNSLVGSVSNYTYFTQVLSLSLQATTTVLKENVPIKEFISLSRTTLGSWMDRM